MIVIDASALVAIAELEPDAARFVTAILGADAAVMSPVNAIEAGMVLLSRGRFATASDLLGWRASLGVTLWPAAPDEVRVLMAFRRFGKGRHPAHLNLGDCFAYALAQQLDAPLLYKGDDFVLTDVRSAL